MGYELNERDVIRIVHTIRSMHDEPPFPAGTRVEFMDRVGEALGAPPTSQQLRRRPHFIDPFLGHVELA
ncbi:hypothetical protein D3C71_2125300 [compost metagenome]